MPRTVRRAMPRAHILVAATLFVTAALAAGPGAARASFLASTAAPTLTSSNATAGVATAGDVLTCGPGSWNIDPEGRSWAWRRDATVLLGQTANTYAVQAADGGTSITCSVTATWSLDIVSSAYSAPISIPAPTPATPPAPPKLAVAVPDDKEVRVPGDLVALAIETDADATMACQVNGATVGCTRTAVWFPVSLPTAQRKADTVQVTASNSVGSTTVTRVIGPTGNKREWKFPKPVIAQAGTTITIFSDLDFLFWAKPTVETPYRFVGDIPGITWTAIGPRGWFSSGTAIRVPLPAKAGTYTTQLRWGPVFLEDELVVRAVDEEKISQEQTFDGIASGKPLTCPGKGPYQWYANGVLQVQTDVPYLPAGTDVFTYAAVDCVSTDPTTSAPMKTQGIVAEGTTVTATLDGRLVRIAINRNATATFAISRPTYYPRAATSSGAKRTPLTTLRVKLKKGRSTIALPASVRRKLGRGRFSVQIRLVGNKGKRSPALTLESR